MLSLDCAEALMREFEVLRKTDAYDMEKHLSFSIHVDAGANGPSKKMIPEVIGWLTHAATQRSLSRTATQLPASQTSTVSDILPGSIGPRLLKERKAREPEIALHRSML